jgi:hypothetical protein
LFPSRSIIGRRRGVFLQTVTILFEGTVPMVIRPGGRKVANPGYAGSGQSLTLLLLFELFQERIAV